MSDGRPQPISAAKLQGMTDEQLRKLYDELDAREFSFTDADADSMTAICREQAKRRSSVAEPKE